MFPNFSFNFNIGDTDYSDRRSGLCTSSVDAHINWASYGGTAVSWGGAAHGRRRSRSGEEGEAMVFSRGGVATSCGGKEDSSYSGASDLRCACYLVG